MAKQQEKEMPGEYQYADCRWGSRMKKAGGRREGNQDRLSGRETGCTGAFAHLTQERNGDWNDWGTTRIWEQWGKI